MFHPSTLRTTQDGQQLANNIVLLGAGLALLGSNNNPQPPNTPTRPTSCAAPTVFVPAALLYARSSITAGFLRPPDAYRTYPTPD